MSRIVGVMNLGLKKYSDAAKVQNVIFEKMKTGGLEGLDGILMIMEHTPVYTVGIRKDKLNEDDKERLSALGADVVAVGRGGLVTFHGPGQLVAWPVLDLRRQKLKGIRNYIHSLESVIISLCKHYNLSSASRNDKYPGVWLGDNKVCAVGVKVSRYITTHGLALNVCTDLSWFSHIIPCGIPGKYVTSISEQLNKNVSISDVIPSFLEAFCTEFACSINGSIENTVHCKKIINV